MMSTPLFPMRMLLSLLLPLLTLLLALFGIACLFEAIRDFGASRMRLQMVRSHQRTADLR